MSINRCTGWSNEITGGTAPEEFQVQDPKDCQANNAPKGYTLFAILERTYVQPLMRPTVYMPFRD